MLSLSISLAALQLCHTQRQVWDPWLLVVKPRALGFRYLSNGDGVAGGNDGSNDEDDGDSDEEDNGTSVSITRTDLWERTLCSITSSIHSVFIEPLQDTGTMVGFMDIAINKTKALSLRSRIVWEAQINR